MKYLVHINPTPGSDLRVVEIEADNMDLEEGSLVFTGYRKHESGGTTVGVVAAFSTAVWNYVEPKK